MKTQPKSFLWHFADKTAALLILSLAVLCLSGCGTQVVYVPQYALQTPPDALLQDCDVAAPPPAAEYVTWTFKKKEGALTDTLTQNYGFQETCNITKSELRQWKAEQIQIVGAKNAELRKKAGAK